ncbi:MAG: hypothetical protein ACRECH_01480 [Nitrososphaerales archaeon]
MPKEGFSVITITQQVHDRAKTRYNQKIKTGQVQDKSFSRFINDIIMDVIEADANLALRAPFMQKIGLEGNSIMIKDNKIERIVEVQIRGKDLVCMLDERKDCAHVGYAYSIPDVYRVMSEKRR